jgi:hypothetical protein
MAIFDGKNDPKFNIAIINKINLIRHVDMGPLKRL